MQGYSITKVLNLPGYKKQGLFQAKDSSALRAIKSKKVSKLITKETKFLISIATLGQ